MFSAHSSGCTNLYASLDVRQFLPFSLLGRTPGRGPLHGMIRTLCLLVFIAVFLLRALCLTAGEDCHFGRPRSDAVARQEVQVSRACSASRNQYEQSHYNYSQRRPRLRSAPCVEKCAVKCSGCRECCTRAGGRVGSCQGSATYARA